jgi:hypothetical protein
MNDKNITKKNKNNIMSKNNESGWECHNPFLCASSLVFMTNVATAIYMNELIYGVLFFGLTLTSLRFHSTNDLYAKCVDQFVIFLIFLWGGYQVYQKLTPEKGIQILIIVATFLTTVFLYHYGYKTNQYCFSSEKCIADNYHSLLHWVASVGHHMIMFL